MNDHDRIDAIQKSGNGEQLDKAMNGFREQAIAAHPVLQHNEDFRRLLETGQYMRALEQIRLARPRRMVTRIST